MVEDVSPETEPPYEYECLKCGKRVTADSQPLECSNCGGEFENISNPRE
ncbi:MAG: rubrerythrin-like domain-containing protein [Halobacteriales archaeon]|nr:rubrerythrin-like domain-containing protein [Halobacteriales archaeon]